MKTFNTGDKVKYGLYIAPQAFDMRFVGADTETLEGKRGAQYYRLPGLLVIAAAPVLGGLFAMSFPIIVIAMVIGALIKAITSGVTNAVRERSHLVNMQWQPTAAYLNKRDRDSKDKDTKTSSELSDLNREVQNRRKEEK